MRSGKPILPVLVSLVRSVMGCTRAARSGVAGVRWVGAYPSPAWSWLHALAAAGELPRVGDDYRQVRAPWCPAQLRAGAGVGGDQRGRVSGAARGGHRGDRMAGDPAG